MKYCIYCRYETWTNNGKVFTKWFNTHKLFDKEDEAKSEMKNMKDFTLSCDKATKLKHEYEVRYIDEQLIPQRRLHRPKGRPKKIDKSELDSIIKVLNKKGKVVIEELMKPYLYNDEEAHKYIQEHLKDQTKWVRYWYDENRVLYLILKDNSEIILD